MANVSFVEIQLKNDRATLAALKARKDLNDYQHERAIERMEGKISKLEIALTKELVSVEAVETP